MVDHRVGPPAVRGRNSPEGAAPRPRTKDQLVALSALAVRVRARPGRISPHIRELFEHVAPTRKTGNASHKTL
jgi:hypothetical protein